MNIILFSPVCWLNFSVTSKGSNWVCLIFIYMWVKEVGPLSIYLTFCTRLLPFFFSVKQNFGPSLIWHVVFSLGLLRGSHSSSWALCWISQKLKITSASPQMLSAPIVGPDGTTARPWRGSQWQPHPRSKPTAQQALSWGLLLKDQHSFTCLFLIPLWSEFDPGSGKTRTEQPLPQHPDQSENVKLMSKCRFSTHNSFGHKHALSKEKSSEKFSHWILHLWRTPNIALYAMRLFLWVRY